jgi:hypothetical protein
MYVSPQKACFGPQLRKPIGISEAQEPKKKNGMTL